MPPISQYTGKAVAIGILTILFIVPSLMVTGLVEERSHRRDQVVAEVSDTWSNAQTVQGPVLVVPYAVSTTDGSGVSAQRFENAFFLAEDLTIHGTLTTETRSRGIYDVPVYAADLDIRGRFTRPDIGALGLAPAQMRYDQAFVMMGVPDMRGMQNRAVVTWNGGASSFVPGADAGGLGSGVRASVPVDPGVAEYRFSLTLTLKGSKELAFVPLGKTTQVELTGDWTAPSFDGAFLPASHTVTDAGFSAKWQVLDLNRGSPQQWTGSAVNIAQRLDIKPELESREGWVPPPLPREGSNTTYAFGVRLFQPTDVYTQSMRAAKYALAVIALVFAVMFFIEATGKRRVHPVQYTLIGLALVIFYALLLSLAEYIPFGSAYLIATVAVVSLVTAFAKHVTGDKKRGLLTGGLLTILYAFTYILLQKEDFTLLIGSIGLFLILGALMWASNRVRWYGE